MSNTYRVWQDDMMAGEYSDPADAARERDRLRKVCAETGCGNGDPAAVESNGIECGWNDSEPHAVSVQIIDNDTDLDVTGYTYDMAILEALA